MAAVTFTRKAAAELRSRFQVALEKRSGRPRAKRRLTWRSLFQVEQCFIGTIHSFCAACCGETGGAGGPLLQEIDEEADGRLRAEAGRFRRRADRDDPRGS